MVNYFELYEIPTSFRPDQALVKKKYYELSRKYHPDRFTLAAEEEQANALKMSSLNNEAYKALNNEDKLMAYVLKLNEILEEEEKYNLPPDFLMEMMDLNEVVSELEMEADNEELMNSANNQLDEQFKDWNEQVTPLITEFENGNHSKALLNQIKDYYFRKKYLLRIKERVDNM